MELDMSLELFQCLSIATGENSIYGGWKGIQGDATGFFHTQEINGVHWLIDPDGYAFISKGVNHVSYTADNAPSLGYSPYGKVAAEKYGSADAYAKASVERLKNWGFNTIGAWSGHETFKQKIPYTLIIDLGGSAGGNWQSGSFPDVFSDEFRQSVFRVAKEQCTPFRDDRFLIGYFTDNELRWGPDWRSTQGLFADFWEMPADTAGKKSAVSFLEKYYETIEKFNATYGTRFISFDEVITALKESKPSPQTEELRLLESGFLRLVAAQYFKVCADAIREYDPNHLILGCRYAGYAPEEVVQSMGDNVDIVSYNNYDFHAPVQKLQQIHEWTGKPVMLTEFSFKAMDSGLPNTKGAGQPVKTQQDRADNFDTYVTELIKLPYAVGFHWFEYADEPAEGRFDGENSNYGLVNIKDETWETLTKRMCEVNTRLEAIHSGN
jgi:agarase